jgi:hypothetical protein
MKITVFWNVTQCNLVDLYQGFEEICCLHIHGTFYLKIKAIGTTQNSRDEKSDITLQTFRRNVLHPSSGSFQKFCYDLQDRLYSIKPHKIAKLIIPQSVVWNGSEFVQNQWNISLHYLVGTQ